VCPTSSPLWGPLLTAPVVQQAVCDVMTYMEFRPSVEITGVAVVPASASVAVGGTVQLRALAICGDGTSHDITAVADWSTADPSVATIAPDAVVTGVAQGSAAITATWSTLSGPATVTVT
jgi:uncharacterized protein YjdB